MGAQQLTKILFIQASADIGGTEISSFQLASHLNRQEFQAGVLFHCSPGPLCADYRKAGIPFWTVAFPRIFPAMRAIRDFQPDIIQIYGMKTNILWRPILAAQKYRIIGVIQGLTNRGENPGFFRVFWDRLTHRLLHRYISNSEVVRAALFRNRFDPAVLQVIYNGIPPGPTPDFPDQKNKTPVIVCLGNLRPVKGHTLLIDALKRIQEQKLDFEAWIIGDGPLREELQNKAQKLGLADRVRFLGRVDQIEPLMRKADIFASLSLSEGIPIAYMEAMSAGLPVVATDVGGVSELIEDGKEGYLVPSQDVHSAAEKIVQLLVQPALRQTMGRAARSRIESRFTLDQTVTAYENLYRGVLSAPRTRR